MALSRCFSIIFTNKTTISIYCKSNKSTKLPQKGGFVFEKGITTLKLG
jgi:hypothetical protein